MSKILIEKNGIVIFKEKDEKDILNIKFDIENTKLDLTKILNIDFFKLIYELNQDIFESINFKVRLSYLNYESQNSKAYKIDFELYKATCLKFSIISFSNCLDSRKT